MTTAEFQPGAKLPFWRTLRDAYGTFFSNISTVLRITWLWLIVLGATAFFLSRAQSEIVRATLQTLHDPKVPAWPPALAHYVWILGPLSGLLSVVAGSSIAVAWHRFLLLRENPSLSGSNVANRSVWRFLLTGIGIGVLGLLLGLPFLLIYVLVFFLATDPTGQSFGLHPTLFAAFLPIGLIPLMLVVARVTLLLPARAIGNDNLTFRDVWQRTKGSTWRLYWGSVLSIVPPLLPMQIALTLSGLAPFPPHPDELLANSFAHAPLIGVISTIYAFAVGIVAVGFLSFAYRYFVGPTSPSGTVATPS